MYHPSNLLKLYKWKLAGATKILLQDLKVIYNDKVSLSLSAVVISHYKSSEIRR